MQNKDSLAGEILLYRITSQQVLITADYVGFSKGSSLNSHNPDSIKWIKFKDIKRIRIDLPEQTENISYEYLAYKKTLWRILRIKDSVCIYSDMIMPRWGLQYAPKQIILKSGEEIKSMYSGLNWFFHNSKTKPLLKNFINSRYHTSFKKSDFKDVDAELDYIVAHG
ncbi:MAG TPA: hypothetical protein VKT28_13895 [Puia sp.]|nr:hypothetical protein [Puia sp.]